MSLSKVVAAKVLVCGLAMAGCGTSGFQAQVVSCKDKTPIPDAKLTYAAVTPGSEKLISEMPGVTSQDGTVRADVTAGKGTTYAMTIQKPGYETKTEQLTSGADQAFCLDPTNTASK